MSELNVIVTEDRLQARVHELAAEITRDYAGTQLDVVCLINGAGIFCADLVRHIRVPVKQHYLGFTSYLKGNVSGEVRLTLDIAEPMQGRHILVVEGIVVSGRTPLYVYELLKLRQPASISLCALAVKSATLAVELPIRYSAFQLGAEIAVGYGVGDSPYRTLPYLVESPK